MSELQQSHLRIVPRDAADAPTLPLPETSTELEPQIYDGEVVEEEPPADTTRSYRLPARIGGRAIAVQPSERTVAVARVAVTVGQGWHSWLNRGWDGLTLGVYRRQIRAAEAMGNQEVLAQWVDRKEKATHQRHIRLMDLPMMVIGVIKVAGIALAGSLVLMLLLSIAVWATGVGSFGAVFGWIGSLIRAVLSVGAFVWTPLMVSLPLLVVFAAWREGRRRGNAPGWLATASDADVDITIDETTIARALGALRIPQITAYLKEGLPLQFLTTARRDGRGTHAVLRLPAGVTAEKIARRRADLATGLYRLAKEVWPTTGSEAGILDLWVADKGALAEGAGPYPLLTEGAVDVFKGVPFGKTLRGDPIVAPLMERNTMTGGMPGQGKSSAARVLMSGASLDPTAELRIWVPDSNFDFEIFRPRCSRYVMGAEDEKIEEILEDLRELHSEVQHRGDLLVKHQEPAVTRKLADAGIGLHPLFCLLEEAHVAFQHKEHGDEIAELAIAIVKLGRKRGIHLDVSTQAPTKDSMPRDITRNCSNGIAFAVGDHVANDALLGQGAYAAGHRATELIPGVDKGTAVCKGLTGERSDIVQVYFISIEKGKDELTPIIERSLEAIAKRGVGIPGRCRPVPQVQASRDLLKDLDEVLNAERIRLADIPGLLRKLAPNWIPYKSITGAQLRDTLTDDYGVRVTNSGNVLRLDPADLRQVLAQRETGE